MGQKIITVDDRLAEIREVYFKYGHAFAPVKLTEDTRIIRFLRNCRIAGWTAFWLGAIAFVIGFFVLLFAIIYGSEITKDAQAVFGVFMWLLWTVGAGIVLVCGSKLKAPLKPNELCSCLKLLTVFSALLGWGILPLIVFFQNLSLLVDWAYYEQWFMADELV